MNSEQRKLLREALARAQSWIGGQMQDMGWPRERVEDPPDGSHLHALAAALALLDSLPQTDPAYPVPVSGEARTTDALLLNIENALYRVTHGHALMSIPVRDDDVDMVLVACREFIEGERNRRASSGAPAQADSGSGDSTSASGQTRTTGTIAFGTLFRVDGATLRYADGSCRAATEPERVMFATLAQAGNGLAGKSPPNDKAVADVPSPAFKAVPHLAPDDRACIESAIWKLRKLASPYRSARADHLQAMLARWDASPASTVNPLEPKNG